jgi:nucleoside-diphosphate-sugar epimerase
MTTNHFDAPVSDDVWRSPLYDGRLFDMPFTGRQVLISGASGFLGSALSRRLTQVGAHVHGLSRAMRPPQGTGVVWWQVDPTDLEALRAVFKTIKPDVLFHLSGLVTASPELRHVLPTFQTLLASTVNLLSVATEVGGCCRIVLASSLTEPDSRSDEPCPGSPYAAAKWASSAYGRMFHQLYGAPVVMARPFMTYGPGQDPRKLIPHVTLSLLRQESPQLSAGRFEADWIYIDDVIDGLVASALRPGVEGKTFDLGTGRLTSVRDVVERLRDLTDPDVVPGFGELSDRPREQVRRADVDLSESVLGWRATTSLDDGLAQTVAWYRRTLLEQPSKILSV